MSTQPRALTLAYEYANRVYDHRRHATSETHHDMLVFREALEAELRRLHAEAEELRGALDEAMWHVKYKELKAVNESDTALLRQAWEALRNDDIQQRMKAITALRERLEVKT
jgi:hypothetical protein